MGIASGSAPNELDIRVISTVFGNGSGEKSYATAIELIRCFDNEGVTPAIHRGADGPLDLGDPKINEVSRALIIV